MTRAAAALALAGALAIAGGARAAALDYLHVEANSGGASGGHAALRFGATVFDFQHGAGGTLWLRRSGWEWFRDRTTVRGNRTVDVARIEVPDADYQRLLAAFEARHLVSGRHFAVREGLRADRRLLERRVAGAPPLPVEGAGLFGPAASGASPALRDLRERVAARHGAGFLANRLRALEEELATLAPEEGAAPLPAFDPDRLPRAPYGIAARRRDLSQWVVALRALDRAASPSAAAVRAGTLRVDDAECAGLARWAQALEDSLVALVASPRVDGGLALLVGMARLDVVRRSVSERRLLLLDDLPREGERLAPGPALRRDPYLLAQRDRAAARFAEERARLAALPAPGEADYDALEEAGNDLLELDAALAGAAPLRLPAGERIPAPAAAVPDLPPLRLDAAALRDALRAARAREAAHGHALRDAFGYRLMTRNCVTELFAVIDDALGDAGAERALGGPVPPPGPLGFVPFASFDAVLASWRVAAHWQEPALRRVELAARYAEENDLRVYLRESNTLTSTVYRRSPSDPFFLFFSDDAPPLRPLLGAANLAASGAWSVLGLARAAFDRGAMLREGVTGAVYSLPELAFVSLRKGTLRYGPPLPASTR